jgi:fructose-1,6-bisphosphatase/inositol monophosphatase family enzyme
MPPPDADAPYGRELAVALDLVAEAGALLVEESRRGAPRGSSASHLDVDVEIEDLLVAGLLDAFPGDGVLAEEKTDVAGTVRRWVIDPHDGTRDFSEGARETSISLALEDRGRLVLGVVHAPCAADVRDPEIRPLFGGAPLLCTWTEGGVLRRNGLPVRASAPSDRLHEGSVALVSRRVHGPALAANRRALRPGRVLPCASIATRLALVACGAADVAYTIRHPLAPWDYLGGQALLRGAGGDLLDARARVVGADPDPRAYVGARRVGLAAEVVARLHAEFPDRIPPPA